MPLKLALGARMYAPVVDFPFKTRERSGLRRFEKGRLREGFVDVK